ncbi:polycystin-1-like protein 2 [Branchiostoma lanceolatum]|uniref:polycystin-1-like protein 2 n=1 Tax=Branchiostoma lanceolatum TaxID=7740 RepID=UPI003454F6AB
MLVFYDVAADQEYRVTLVVNGLYGDSLPVEVICSTLTPPPEDFQVNNITETTVRVSWKKQRPNSLAIGHRMWIRRSDTTESLVTRHVPTSRTDVTFDNLSPAVEYVISATSINGHNEGLEVTVTVVTRTDPPVALGVDDWTTDTISISWAPPKAALTTYNITYTGNGRRSSLAKSGDADSCELTGLIPGTQYDIDVVAVSRLGRSVAVSTRAVTDTDPPSSLRVPKASATWMFLEWKPAVANVTSYELDISDEYDSAITYLRIEGNKTSYNVTNLIPETAYVIKMAALSEHGRSVGITYSQRTEPILSIEVSTDGHPYSTTAFTTARADATTSMSTWSTSTAAQNINGIVESTASTVKTTIEPDAIDELDDDAATDLRTTTSSDTSTGKSTEPALISTTSSSGSDQDIPTTSLARTTESPGQKLQELVEGLDISDVSQPEDIIAVTSNINEIINANGDDKSPLPPSVLKSAADIVSDLADAMKGSQGTSVENMATIADALVQTASTVVDMLPEPETPLGSTSDPLFGSDVDIENVDLSPKQQVKMLKEKQKEKEDAQRETAQSIVASLDHVGHTLLALQPPNVKYRTSFKTASVAVAVVRSPASEDIQLDSDQIVANIPGRAKETQTNDILDVQISVFDKNPYSWAESTGGQNISSPVAFLTVKSNEQENLGEKQRLNLNIPFISSQPREQPTNPPPLEGATENPNGMIDAVRVSNGDNMTHHAFAVPEHSVPVVRMNWRDVEEIFYVYSAYGYLPTAEKYAEKRVVKEDGYEAWLRGTNFSISFIPNTTDHGVAMSIHGRSQQPYVQSPDKEDYTLSISALGCSSWKDSKKQWGLGDCDVKVNLNDAVVSCDCTMTESSIAVGTMTLPVPNSIDFLNAFSNFRFLSDNAAVFSTVMGEYVLYIFILALLDLKRIRATLRRTPMALYDRIMGRTRVKHLRPKATINKRKKLSKVSLISPERMPAPHVYQLTVTTGSMFGAGTTSRVGFQLFGSKGTTPVKMLNPGGEALVRGSTLHFVMPVRESLGEVMLLHIWHDNSGEGDPSSWFLGSFVVRDVEKDVVSYFTCNDWLSEDKGDGEVQKVVHAGTEEELSSFSNVFSEATRHVFYDKQLWASALVAAPGSSFTKSQRLSCCFALLNTMMLASAMWYKAETTTAGTGVLNLGFVRFTIEELYISLMSILTVVSVNLMIVQLFRVEAPLTVDTPEMVIRASKQGRLQKSLLRWARYVAWVTVFLVSTISAFFVILYSMDWGEEKSDAWMKAFVLSFIGSSCVVETLQIFVLAVVLAAIFSLPFLAKPPAIRKDDIQLNLWNSTAPKKLRRPAKANLKSAKKKKELGKRSASTMTELLLLLIFAALLFYIAQMDKDTHAFHERQTLSNNILNDYDTIRTPDQFYSWLEDVLLPTLYPSAWYNGRKMKYLDRQFAQNTAAFRIGPPRLTQIRQRPGAKAKDKDAGRGWDVPPGNMSCTSWRFDMPTLSNHPNYTKSNCKNLHSLNLPLDYKTAMSFINALGDSEYLDKYTKSVTIDINFYNPNLKLFSVVKMAIDRSGIGSLMPKATITSFRLFQYESDNDYVSLFLHIVFTLFYLVLLLKEVKTVVKEGWGYCASLWNALGWVGLVGTATVISVFIKRYAVATDTLNMVAKSNGELGFEDFVDLTAAAWWDACFKHVLGLVVFTNAISLLRVVRFSQTIGKLLALPGIMKDELLSFLVVAAVAFIAFISSGYLVFGPHMESYSDLYHTTFALFEMVLGRFFANEMLDSNPLIGPMFFTTFMICIFILLMNFLMTIICDAISADVDVTHDRDLVDHMWRSFKAMLGFHSAPNKEDKTEGVSKMEELQANLRILQEGLDESLAICNSVLPRSNRRLLTVKAPKFQTRALQTGPVINTDYNVTINIEPASDSD